jgi:putative ATP-dependent endonuclease of OLD family
MRLRHVRIHNFRCYGAPTDIAIDDLTVLVGRNDAGKSAILDALNVFFGNAKLDADDRCKHAADDAEISMTCEFDDLPASVDLDAGNPTTLTAEHLLTDSGTLKITKVYRGKTPVLKGIVATALHPTVDGAADLLTLKRTQLKDRAKKVGADLTDVNEGVNAELRAAIRATFADLNLQSVQISLDKEDAKTAWDKIESHMPVFALFKSDRESSDQDEEAQDPLSVAVASALKSKESELAEISAYVTEEVQRIANATLAKLRQMDPELASELKSQFEPQPWSKLFKATIACDAGVPLNKRGSGVRRLILLNFFRAKVDQLITDRGAAHVIYAVEEPETSQHPHNQRLLIRALQDLLQTDKCQVMLTTHTPILARGLDITRLRFVRSGAGNCPVVESITDANWESVAHSLGVLPETTVRLIVFLEGKHDIPFMMNLADALRQQGLDVPDLRRLEQEGKIIFAPLGGQNLLLWTNRTAQLLKPEFHLYDRDNTPPLDPKYKAAIDAVMMRASTGEPVYASCTARKEMENYLPISAINAALAADGLPPLPRGSEFAAFEDVPVLFTAELNALLPAHAQWSTGRTKTFLNNHAVSHITPATLNALDPAGEVGGWFARIAQMMQ